MSDKKDLLKSINSLSSDGSIQEDREALEDEIQNNLKKRSIKITYIVMFFTSVSYSIQMPSIWPYMNIINPSYSKEFLGWVVAAYSIGQLVACPVFSYASGKSGHFRIALIISSLLAIGGNYLYAIISDLNETTSETVALLVSRAVIGISGANIASIRLFLTLATTEEERLVPMSILSACQGLGFIIGPGLQAAFVPIGYPGILEISFIRINMYTASGFFGVISNFIILLVLAIWFSDKFLRKSTIETKTVDETLESAYQDYDSLRLSNEFVNDYFSAIFTLISFFFCMMSLAILETSSTPMSMDNFGWSKSYATLINSIVLAVCGICCLFVFLGIRFITKIIKEKLVLLIGFIFVLLSAISLIPFGNKPIPIHNITYNTTGCDIAVQPWCSHVPALEFWQYILSISFFTLGYPTANLLSYVIFSRLIDPSSQSLWMGLLTASGSSARVIGPIFITKLYENFGTQIAFGSWSSIIFLFLLFQPLFIWKISKTENLREFLKRIN